jgi:hypothetical protein
MNEKLSRICNWCYQPAVIIWVHGHGQCSVCEINVDEYCKGEKADPPVTSTREGEKDKSD